jgi:hypothetical protein
MHWIYPQHGSSSSVDHNVDNGPLRNNCTFSFNDEGQSIVQTLFTHFPSSPSSDLSSDLSPSRRASGQPAFIVVLKNLIHIIYPEGGSYRVHLPFPVLKVWSVPLGLVLERQLDPVSSLSHESPLPRLLTLSSPLEDFGMVTCNGSSLDSDEEIVFISSQKDALCLTRNRVEGSLTLWYVSPDHLARRKVRSILPAS